MSLFLYAGCIFLFAASIAYLTWLFVNWLIQWHRKYTQIQQQTRDKFWNKRMIITNDRVINNQKYWVLFLRLQCDELTQTEESELYDRGVAAEKAYRLLGSSLLPLSEDFAEIRSMPVEKIDRRLMIAIGINVTAFGGLTEDSADVD